MKDSAVEVQVEQGRAACAGTSCAPNSTACCTR